MGRWVKGCWYMAHSKFQCAIGWVHCSVLKLVPATCTQHKCMDVPSAHRMFAATFLPVLPRQKYDLDVVMLCPDTLI